MDNTNAMNSLPKYQGATQIASISTHFEPIPYRALRLAACDGLQFDKNIQQNAQLLLLMLHVLPGKLIVNKFSYPWQLLYHHDKHMANTFSF